MFREDHKKQAKVLNILWTKIAFNMKQKAFFIIFKGLSLNQIKPAFLKGQSPTLIAFNLVVVAYVSSGLSF